MKEHSSHRGQISLLGEDVLNAREKQLRQWRGARVAMIFQEPMTALNPTRRIGLQMMDVIRHHQPISRREARAKAIALLEEMQIPDAVEVMSRYPFELSGGMRQRVMIALAYSCEPQLIIADEPTTALDVTVQLQVLRSLKHKARASGTAVLFISHDMAVVSQLCDSVYVMYAGSVIESGVNITVKTGETQMQLLDVQNGLGHDCFPPAFGSSRSRIPSPKRLNPTAVSKIAAPGNAQYHH